MESDDLKPNIPRKRSRSPSIAPNNDPQAMDAVADQARYVRQPKRQRRSKTVPKYDERPDENVLQRMERSNPLSRKILKKEAKRARKAHRVKTAENAQAGGIMEVDDDGLQFTFMA